MAGPAARSPAAASPAPPPAADFTVRVASERSLKAARPRQSDPGPRLEAQEAPPPPQPLAPLQPLQPPPAQQPQPPSNSFRLWTGLLFGVLACALAAVVLIVLWRAGVLGKGGGGDDWQPLPYAPRIRPQAAQPAFEQELHPWLLPPEQEALGLQLDADVVIVGAGVAGLKAAATLAALAPSVRVLLLEARDRVGGRVHSLPFAGGFAELGAQFIWGAEGDIDGGTNRSGNPVTEAANVLGMTRSMVGAGDSMLRQLAADGTALAPRTRLSLQRWAADVAALASRAPSADSLADVLEQPALGDRVGSSRSSLALLEAALGAAMGARHGAPLDRLSALHHANTSSFKGVDNVVLSGYLRLPEALAASLRPGVLQLSTPVAAISHGDSNATVWLATGEVLTSQYVLCTVPLGVLTGGALALEPALPEQTQAALRGLGVGQLETLWLQFDQVFWEGGGACGAGDTRAPCQFYDVLDASTTTRASSSPRGWRLISMGAFGRRPPVLVATAAGAAAAAWQEASDAAVVRSVMASLRAAFPGKAPAAPRAYALSRWGRDPWALGALSYAAAGSTGPGERATLGEPQSGSLMIAGEAAWSAHPSTVHGALLSGQEAAMRVLDAAAELPECGSGGGGGKCLAAPGGQEPLQCGCDGAADEQEALDVGEGWLADEMEALPEQAA